MFLKFLLEILERKKGKFFSHVEYNILRLILYICKLKCLVFIRDGRIGTPQLHTAFHIQIVEIPTNPFFPILILGYILLEILILYPKKIHLIFFELDFSLMCFL